MSSPFVLKSDVDELGAASRATEECVRSDLPHVTASGQAALSAGEVARQVDSDSVARPSPPKFTRDEVAMHYEEGDCWIIISGKVYDVTSFLDTHPGGLDVIMEYAGLDATSDFEDLPHPPEAYEMLKAYLKGEIA